MKSIRGKMLVWFGMSLLILLTASGVVVYREVDDAVTPLTKHLSQEVLIARSAEIGRLLEGYVNEVTIMSRRDLIRRGDMEEIESDLMAQADLINSDYEILFYADRDGNYVTTQGKRGDVRNRDYYKAIMLGEHSYYISEPVVSYSTGARMLVVGIMAATVLLKTLSEIAGAIEIGEQGFGYIVDRTGLLIAYPEDELVMTMNYLESEEWGYQGLEEIGERMLDGMPGLMTYENPNGEKLVTVFNPIPGTASWTLGISLYEDELMGPAMNLMRQVVLLMSGILGIVLLVVFIISKRITTPILALKEGVRIVSAGNLEHVLEIRTGDEIEELADDFSKMKTDLMDYIENLKKTTAEKERIQSELEVANKIQTSMLPRIFPPYPNMANLDLYATMEPAKEVGGDFYDFFLIDDHRLCFSIGDVSGKGIPAALFMVITRTILKNLVLQGNSMPDIFFKTNNLLCSDNEENMFVTVFMGILDTRTGELEYISAGHNPPLVSREGRDFEFLKVNHYLVLGGMEDYRYDSLTTVLKPRDRLFVYTDGVSEATNGQNELLGDGRMVAAANRLVNRDVRGIIAGMREEIDRFVLDTPASDDVTMLALMLLEAEA